jgi:hypothetical protein
MKRVEILLWSMLVLLALCADGFGQTGPDTLWTRTYEGSGDEQLLSGTVANDNGYVFVGSTTTASNGGSDILVFKIDDSGNIVWQGHFGDQNNEIAYSICNVSSGGYAITGIDNQQSFIMRISDEGDSLAYVTLSGSEGWSIIETSDRGFVVAGTANDTNTSGHIAKTDEFLNIEWQKRYGGTGSSHFHSVRQVNTGELFVAGHSTSFGTGDFDIWLLKLTSSGDSLWSRFYGTPDWDFTIDMIPVSTGGFLITGYVYEQSAYLIRINGQGDTLWSRIYGGTAVDRSYSTSELSDGTFIVAGVTYSFGHGSGDYWLFRIRNDGSTIWSQTYGTSNDEGANKLLRTSDGGYIIAGTSRSGDDNSMDAYIVKTAPDPCYNSPPATPQVVLQVVNSDARLSWNPVRQSVGGCPITTTHYLVFYAPTSEGPYYYHGFTADTSYVHRGVVRYATGMYYHVIASTAPAPLLMLLPGGGLLKEEDVSTRLHLTDSGRYDYK